MARKTMKAMVVFQGASGLAEDKCVNTFTFRHNTADGPLEAADFTEVRAAVEGFYQLTGAQGTAPAQSWALGAYLSPWLSRTGELRLYDLNQAPPRVPIISPITLAAALGTTGYPEESCVCLSFRTLPPSTARRRGRIFFGPLSISIQAVAAATNTAATAVTAGLMNDLVRAANRLSALTPTMRWVTLSSFDSDTTVHPVVYAWVDNALDTQRRRGPKAGTRVVRDLDQPA